MENENDFYELLKKIKKFETRSNARFKEQFDRIKNDKEFLWEKPLSKEVDSLLGKKRYRGHLDVVSNAIRSIVNSYTSYPYHARTQNPDLTEFYDKLKDDISESVENAFKNAVSFGLGYVIVLPQERNGLVIPIPYNVDKIENVYYDPDSTDMNGSDANECLIVDYKSKSFIKQKYGEEVANKLKMGDTLTLTMENIPDDYGAIFTYFKRENGIITIYKIVCDTLVEEPIQLQLKQLPIVPIYGEAIEIDNKRVYRGIVSQCKVLQDMTDMTASQLMERLAKSPKNIWLGVKEAFANNLDNFQNSDKNINQVLWVNSTKDGKEIPMPQRIEQTVEYGDLTGIMSNTIDLMQSVVGVQSIGLPDEKNEITATEALLNAKTYNNNIRHFMNHLKYSFKALCELIANYFNLDEKIVVENGPQENLERQSCRVELSSLAQLLTDPIDKKRAVMAIASTMDDNQFVKPFIEAINTPDPQVQQLQQTIQMQQQNYEQQIFDLKNQIQLLKAQAISLDARNKDSLRKAELDNQTKILIETMKQEGLDGRQAREQVHDDIEQARKEQAEDNRAKLDAINKVIGGEQ